MKVCGEETIDYHMIGDEIVENSKYLNILSIGYDSYKSTELTNYLKAMGVKCLKPYKQTYAAFTAPVESLEIGLSEDKMKIDDNPIIVWMFGNAVLDKDNLENCKPLKISPSKKIDGVITILESLGQFLTYKR